MTDSSAVGGGGGGAERGTIFRLQVYERGREFCHFGLQKGRNRLIDEFSGFKKSRKLSGFVIDLYLKDSTSTAVEGCKIPN